jgi:demethylspheroidene O-methyltransferase
MIHDKTLRLRWVLWRNRLLASQRFQRLAARMPLLSPVARRRARALFDLVAGFTYSQVLAACVESGLLTALAEAPLSLSEAAGRTHLPEAGALRLLRAAAALDLVEPVGDGWTLGQAGAALTGNPGIAEMVAHHRLLYSDLADPLGLLRRGGGGGELQRFWRYAGAPGQGDPEAVAAYSRLMAASQPLVAKQVLDSYRFARHRRVLDVGGGEGAFLAALGARVPTIERGLFDLPAVVARAGERLGGGVQLHGGSFLADPLPQGFDLVTLVRVLHDHDNVPAQALLARIAESLTPGGRLLIAEPMAGVRGAEAMGDAYFGLYLLAMGSGRPRPVAEITAMLHRAGFSRVRRIATSMPLTVSIVVANK